MILVTGATGQLGRAIVDHLLERVGADQVIACVRDPDAAGDLGVEVRQGDYEDQASLERAFAGATRVLVVSLPRLGDEAVALNTTAIDAAYAAGAERVIYTSQQASGPDSAFAPARTHAATEAHLEALGRPYTALRNGYYTTSLLFHLGDAPQTGVLRAPADGPVTWTAPDDLAEAAAAILAGEEAFDGPTPPLTAATAVDLDEVAAMLTIRREVVADEAYVAAAVERGTPEPLARMLLGSYEAARNGEFASPAPTLARLLGREPVPVEAALARALGTDR